MSIDSPARLAYTVMDHLMAPWRLGLIEIWMEEDFKSGGYRFRIISSTFVDDDFVYRIDRSTLLQEEELAIDMGQKAAEFWLSLTEPVPDNIILGEE